MGAGIRPLLGRAWSIGVGIGIYPSDFGKEIRHFESVEASGFADTVTPSTAMCVVLSCQLVYDCAPRAYTINRQSSSVKKISLACAIDPLGRDG